jgi:CrcB protein
LVGALQWVAAAGFGALGALARFRVDGAVSARVKRDFPAGTLVVNLTGAFALGLLTGAAVSTRVAFVFGTGFMGGYTTFSTWMVETERLGEAGQLASGMLNLAVSMLAGFAAVAAGFYLGQALA